MAVKMDFNDLLKNSNGARMFYTVGDNDPIGAIVWHGNKQLYFYSINKNLGNSEYTIPAPGHNGVWFTDAWKEAKHIEKKLLEWQKYYFMDDMHKYMLKKGKYNVEFYGKFIKKFTTETRKKNKTFDYWDDHYIYTLQPSANGDAFFIDNLVHNIMKRGVTHTFSYIYIFNSYEAFINYFRFLYSDEDENKLYNGIKKYFKH